jgi:hypothetical protein
MASQAEIQAGIDEIVTGAQYPAIKMRPLLTSMLDFSSAGQTVVFDGLVANNTTMADTTLVLEYGVNIVVTSTLTNYACRLPTPVTGRRVIVVNRSLINISLFPSMVGGQINNYPIDAPAIIPPDGNAYDFICIENPLPGAWTWSAPATAQYDSGEITSTTTLSTSYLYASSPAFVAERAGLYSTNISFNGLNVPPLPNPGTPLAMPNSFWGPAFKPSGSPWSRITKVKVYTNISSNGLVDVPQALIWASQQYNTYLTGTQTFVSDGLATSPQFYFRENPLSNFGFNLNNVIAGIVPAPGVTANIGDAGTCWGEISVATNLFSSTLFTTTVGDAFVSTDGTNDIWLTTFLGMGIRPRIIATDIKFQFFIEYM